ncbi:MAG: YhcH/YjgK/YiaL family protein [Clostridia bacterium]|nr:YhcH/YjgK/YiaL family protein [Clostridia bacterium]
MIFDKMERLPLYKGLNANLDRLIDYVLACDYDKLAPGRNEVDGDNCWLNNNVAQLKPATALFEHHAAYVDLQIPIDEGEIITIRPVEDLEWRPFVGDDSLAEGPAGMRLDMVPGTFAIFFPGDAHNCGISKAGQTQARKLVGKARL